MAKFKANTLEAVLEPSQEPSTEQPQAPAQEPSEPVSPEPPAEVREPFPSAADVQEAQREANPISFDEPVGPADLVAVVEDAPAQTMTPEELRAIHEEATAENEKRDFFARLMEARRVPADPSDVPPPPRAPKIVERTNAEMARGRKAVAQSIELQALHRPKPVDPAAGKMTSVYRPDDYVPDPKKGQGFVGARTLSGA